MRILLLLATAFFVSAGATAQPMFVPDAAHIVWQPVAAGQGIAGAIKTKLITGDLAKPGPFVVLFKFPPGCWVHTHTHPVAEVVTILSGSFEVGIGAAPGAGRLRTLRPGGYLYLPANTPHYGWTRQGAIMEVEMSGPFVIHYLRYAHPLNPRCSRRAGGRAQ